MIRKEASTLYDSGLKYKGLWWIKFKARGNFYDRYSLQTEM